MTTTSLILTENMRVTRFMSRLAAQGCAGVLIRRPLSNKTTSVNSGVPLPAKRAVSMPKPPSAKPVFPAPPLYKTGFGFIPKGAPRTPEEREHLHKERLAFLRRARAYRPRDLPRFKFRGAPTIAYDTQYTREYVSKRTGYRIIPSPALLAPPATTRCGQVLEPDLFTVVPEICEHAPSKWDEWHATPRPEYSPKIDRSMLFVPTTASNGDFYAEDMARFLPFLWRRALAEHNCEVRLKKKKRLSMARAVRVCRSRRL